MGLLSVIRKNKRTFRVYSFPTFHFRLSELPLLFTLLSVCETEINK